MIYLFLIAIAILSIGISLYARKKINECETEKERKEVKAKWQLICGLFGLACIICAVIIAFIII